MVLDSREASLKAVGSAEADVESRQGRRGILSDKFLRLLAYVTGLLSFRLIIGSSLLELAPEKLDGEREHE